MNKTFAIIGGGLTGTSTFIYLINTLKRILQEQPRPSIKIYLLEKNACFGPGYPYSKENHELWHLLNSRAYGTSLFVDKPNDFVDWLNSLAAQTQLTHYQILYAELQQIDPLLARHYDANLAQQNNFYPRLWFGAYLTARFEETLTQLKADKLSHIKVQWLSHTEVIDLIPAQAGIKVIFKSTTGLRSFKVDHAFLCTGYWQPKKFAVSDRFLAQPFSAPLIKQHVQKALADKTPQVNHFGILGSGLSAIDTALTICKQFGSFSEDETGVRFQMNAAQAPVRITFYSRKGRLPQVRGIFMPYKGRFFSTETINRHKQAGKFNLKTVEDLLLSELHKLLIVSGDSNELTDLYWSYYYKLCQYQVKGLIMSTKELFRGDSLVNASKISNAKELEAALAKIKQRAVSYWQTVLLNEPEAIMEAYTSLSFVEKKQFANHYATYLYEYISPMNFHNAERILALLKADILTIASLSDSQMKLGKEELVEELIQTKKLACLIDCSGIEHDISNTTSALSQAMIRNGLVEPIQGCYTQNTPQKGQGLGSIAIDLESLQLKPQSGQRLSISYIGIGLQRQVLISAAFACVQTAKKAVDAVMAMHFQPRLGKEIPAQTEFAQEFIRARL